MSPAVKKTSMGIGLGVAVAALGSAAAWGLGWGFVNDENLDDHVASVESHPIIQQKMNSNYEKIQLQLGNIEEKLDRALGD
jgi:hypothetical protein